MNSIIDKELELDLFYYQNENVQYSDMDKTIDIFMETIKSSITDSLIREDISGIKIWLRRSLDPTGLLTDLYPFKPTMGN